MMEELTEEAKKEAQKVQEVKEAPKPKRFENHTLAFMYLLKIINANCLWDTEVSREWSGSIHKTYPYRNQRRWLLEVAHQTLCKAHWAKDGNGDWVLITTETIMEDGAGSYQRILFTDEEYKQVLSWELIDYQVRLITEKKSFLSRSLRDFVMEVFAWVDNFVAKEGEEVTMTLEDIQKIDSPEEIMKKAQEVVSNTDTEESKED